MNHFAATPTASGKTLVFALPVLERLLEEPGARALFLYPTKALAQDQVQGLRELAAATGRIRPPRFDLYDGDTPDALRRKIRKDPPEVLVTNPDMLHLGILAHHDEWDAFLRGLRFVVLDELHVYRGVFGAHVHHILRRLKRLAAARGAHPRFVASSATVGNAAEFAETLVGEPFTAVERSGAPMAARECLVLQPGPVSPYTLAVRVLAEAAAADLRSIAFTKARGVAELVHQWLAREHPELRRKIAPYRAGYLPEERREIERRLFRGELLAVISTSALELGVDVGGLDLCVLVGYPGSRTSTWQRIGRVGRSGRDAVVVWIALPDALDQTIHCEDGNMLRSFLIYLSKAAWAQRLVSSWDVAWRAASRFVAGTKIEYAIRVVRELNARGINATLDHLGEHTSTVAEAAQATEDILQILDEIDRAKVRANVSIKLTQIGMGLDEQVCRQNLQRILQRAKEHRNFIRIDIEDTPYTDVTFSTYRSMLERSFTTKHVGVAVQSYLYRSEADTRKLLEQGTRIRLVKGAYKEPPEKAFPKKADVDANYDLLAKILIDATLTEGSSESRDGRIPPTFGEFTGDSRRSTHWLSWRVATPW